MNSLKYLSINQLAELSNKDRATVRKRLKDVKPYKRSDRLVLYEGKKVLPILLEPTQTELIKREKLRTLRAKADELEMEVAKFKQEHCHINDIQKVVKSEYDRVRTRINSIPESVAEAISKTQDVNMIHSLLSNVTNNALIDLSSEK